MKVVTVHLPEAYVEFLDILVQKGIYANKAEAIRMAVRDFLAREAVSTILMGEKRDAK